MKTCVLFVVSVLPLYSAALKSDGTQWIDSVGGTVTRNAQGQITGVSLRGTWVSDDDLGLLTQLPELNTLDLSLTHITDQGMQEIKDLQRITELNLHFAEYVTDEGIFAAKGASD